MYFQQGGEVEVKSFLYESYRVGLTDSVGWIYVGKETKLFMKLIEGIALMLWFFFNYEILK